MPRLGLSGSSPPKGEREQRSHPAEHMTPLGSDEGSLVAAPWNREKSPHLRLGLEDPIPASMMPEMT